MSANTQAILRESVEFITQTTYTGVFAESDVLHARLILELLIRNDTAVEIDFTRYYQAIQRVNQIKRMRNTVVYRYNLILKVMELRNIEIPSGIPRRILLTPTDWTVTYQYIER
jgi:hypothetical protein